MVCSAFIEKEGKFLIVMCPILRVWRVPGGGPEHGERLEDALIRGMEEVGLRFTNPGL